MPELAEIRSFIGGLQPLGFEERFERERELNRFLQDNPVEPTETVGVTDYIADILLGVPRGLLDFSHSIYNLADTLTLDVLPDLGRPTFFGESRTVPGQLIEGLTQFAAGFIPALGWVGRGSQIARGGGIVAGIKGAAAKIPAPRAITTLASKTEQARRAAALAIAKKSGNAVGLRLKAGGLQLAQATTAAAIADGVAFDGNEQRLSNLVETFPFLQNDVTGFLAAQEDDPQLLGRLKNVLEGAGVGALFDGVFEALRAVKLGRRLRTEGKTPTQAFEAMDEAGHTERIQQGLDDAERQAQAQARTDPRITRTSDRGPDGPIYAVRVGDNDVRIFRKGNRWFRADEPTVDIGGSQEEAVRRLEQEDARQRIANTIRDAEIVGFEEPGTSVVQDSRQFQQLADDAATRVREILRSDILGPSDVNPRDLTPQQLIAQELDAKDLNLSRMERDPADVTRAMERLHREAFGKLKEKVSDEDLLRALPEEQQRLADLTKSDSLQEMQSVMGGDIKSAEDLMFRTLAWKSTLKQLAKDQAFLARELRQQAARGQTDKNLLARFVSVSERTAVAGQAVKGLTAIQGRGLRTGRLPYFTQEELALLITEAGGEKSLQDFARKVEEAYFKTPGEKGAGAVLDLDRGMLGSRGMDILTEYWINAILSGPKTLVVNALSGALLSVYMPFEQLLGSAITFNRPEIRKSALQLMGLTQTFRDSLAAAKQAALEGRPLLLADAKIIETASTRRAITATGVEQSPTPLVRAAGRMFDVREGSIMGGIVDFIGTLMRAPGSVMTATDELFKQLNARSVAFSRFTDEGLERGLGLRASIEHAHKRIDDLIFANQLFSRQVLEQRIRVRADEQGIDHDGQPFADDLAKEKFIQREVAAAIEESGGVMERVAAESREAAEDVTLTRPLRRGVTAPEDFFASTQEMVRSHPFLRFVVPFIRTPFRLLQFGHDRSLGVITGFLGGTSNLLLGRGVASLRNSRNRLLSDLFAEGANAGLRRARAFGRMSTAIGGFATFMQLAQNGTVTGRGPRDRDQRRILEAAGWQPYSIRIGDTYISYLRADPFATMMGSVADLFTIGRFALEEDQGVLEQIGMSLVVSLTENVTNKTYLTGLSNFVGGLTDPESRLGNVVERYASSFVPNLFGQASGAVDSTMRETRGLVDAALNRIPYYGEENLEPVRNFLGEPVRSLRFGGEDPVSAILGLFNPLAYNQVRDDFLMEEVGRLNHAFRPPRARFGGLDLRAFQSPSGQTAFDRMLELRKDTLIGGRDLRRALRDLVRSSQYQRLPIESTVELPSPRIAAVRSVIRRYHSRAVKRMLREFPELALELTRQREERRRASGF